MGLFLPRCRTVLLPVELYKVPVRPFLSLAEVCLDGRTNIWCVNHSFQLIFTYKLAEVAVCPSI